MWYYCFTSTLYCTSAMHIHHQGLSHNVLHSPNQEVHLLCLELFHATHSLQNTCYSHWMHILVLHIWELLWAKWKALQRPKLQGFILRINRQLSSNKGPPATDRYDAISWEFSTGCIFDAGAYDIFHLLFIEPLLIIHSCVVFIKSSDCYHKSVLQECSCNK